MNLRGIISVFLFKYEYSNDKCDPEEYPPFAKYSLFPSNPIYSNLFFIALIHAVISSRFLKMLNS